MNCLQYFDAVHWVAGRASGLHKTEWWGAGMVTCVGQGADLHPADAIYDLLSYMQCDAFYRLQFEWPHTFKFPK